MGSSTTRLQKWQKNEIFEAIEIAGLNPREFDLEDVDTNVRIKHRWSASYFIIGGSPLHYVVNYVVGDGQAWPYDINVHFWQAVVERFKGWLGDVKRDLETPDLWAELQQEAELLGVASDEVTQNTPFTPVEQEEIARQLRELAKYAEHTYSLSEAPMRILNEKIDYLVQATHRLGRKDWLGLFIAIMYTLVIQALVPPEFARPVLLILLRGIAHLFGLPELPSG